jgi:hypothetical protein
LWCERAHNCRQATTFALCTSRPAHRLRNVFIAATAVKVRSAVKPLLFEFYLTCSRMGPQLAKPPSVDDKNGCSKDLRLISKRKVARRPAFPNNDAGIVGTCWLVGAPRMHACGDGSDGRVL